MIALMSFLAAVLSTLLGDFLLLFGAFMGMVYYTYTLRRDLESIEAFLYDAFYSGKKEKHRDFPQRLESSSSEVTGHIFSLLDGLRARLSALQWDSESKEDASFALDEKLLRRDRGEKTYFKEVVDTLEERFRANALAIVLYDGKYKMFSKGVRGDRFKTQLQHFLSSYLEEKEKRVFGLKDLYDSGNLLSDLLDFGCRYSVCYPLKLQGKERGVLWLGYRESQIPSETEQRWIQEIAKKLGRQVVAHNKFSTLYEEVQQVENDAIERSKFFANMSHDIRTPLNNLKNLLSLVQFEESSPDTRDMVGTALDNCDQMADIVDDILSYSRFQLGQLTANTRPANVLGIVKRLVDGFRPAADVKGLELEFTYPRSQTFANVDVKHLRRIVSNLISNAIKYTKSGRVEVRILQPKDGILSIVVEDTGVGLTEKQVDELFRPFTRFDTTGAEGIGLGLALSQVLAKLSNAEIIASSTVGQGSKFDLQLQAVHVEMEGIVEGDFHTGIISDTSNRLLEGVLSQDQREKITVLVVDDDKDAVDSLVRLLGVAKFKAIASYTVFEAFQKLEQEHIDYIVSDDTMPDGGGGAVLRRARTKGIPALIASGNNTPQDIERIQALGAAKFLPKPIEIKSVVDWVEEEYGKRQDAVATSTDRDL